MTYLLLVLVSVAVLVALAVMVFPSLQGSKGFDPSNLDLQHRSEPVRLARFLLGLIGAAVLL